MVSLNKPKIYTTFKLNISANKIELTDFMTIEEKISINKRVSKGDLLFFFLFIYIFAVHLLLVMLNG